MDSSQTQSSSTQRTGRKLKVGVIDLVAPGPTWGLRARILLPHFGTVMSQAVAVWCRQDGHQLSFTCYTGREPLSRLLPDGCDVVFINSFTQTALVAYAISAYYRSSGTVTVLGGPHARSFPGHALEYFDYVVGLADRALVRDILSSPAPQRPRGIALSAARNPAALPLAEERWDLIQSSQRGSPQKSVALLGSLGCPYNCHFCCDSEIEYQPLSFEALQQDLRFIRRSMRRPIAIWHDPNFGVRFDAYLDAIEDAVPPGSIEFIAETSLALLTEPRVQRLARNGFKAMLPGIESWSEFGNKARTGHLRGRDKVRHVAEHVNLIQRYIPYIQANVLVGLDSDEGDEPFELTAEFIDRAPGAFTTAGMVTSFGQSAPLGAALAKEHRLIATPFPFLTSRDATNVVPKHYSWPELYDRLIRLVRHNFSWKSIWRRHRAVQAGLPRWINLVRVTDDGWDRTRQLEAMRREMDVDRELRRFLEGETAEVPAYFSKQIRRQLGEFWSRLPAGALQYDPVDVGADAPAEPRYALANSA